MREDGYHILPMSPDYLDAALELEKKAVQGKSVQLEIIKENFLSRAIPFSSHFACMALDNKNGIVGSAIGAQTKLIVNNTNIEAGFAFDTKVSQAWRGRHVGRTLAKNLYTEFFNPQGLKQTFMTAKLSNLPVLRLASHTVPQTWVYPFVYLTIPTSARFRIKELKGKAQRFHVKVFDKENIGQEYYSEMKTGLGYFRTFKNYRLKIRKISTPYRIAISFMKICRPQKFRHLPTEQDVLGFAVLYNHNPSTLWQINEVLEELESEGVKQLLVCCSKEDDTYRFFRNKSINTYDYCLVSDFEINKTDTITIDARCL
jgi:hypothetical protein